MIRPTTKDKSCLDYIDFLEKKLEKYEKSPYCRSFIILKNQYDDIMDQLEIREDVEYDPVQKKDVPVVKGRIDIFGSKNDKDLALKFFKESFDLLKELEKFRAKMTEPEKKESDDAIKLREGSTAEKYIFNKP